MAIWKAFEAMTDNETKDQLQDFLQKVRDASSPYDKDNTLLSPSACYWHTCIVDTPNGQRVMLTIRTTSVTLTLFPTRDEAESLAWDIMRSASEIQRDMTTDPDSPGSADDFGADR